MAIIIKRKVKEEAAIEKMVTRLVFGPVKKSALVQSVAPNACVPNPKQWPFSNVLASHIWSGSVAEKGKCVRCGRKRGVTDHHPKMVVPDALKHQLKERNRDAP